VQTFEPVEVTEPKAAAGPALAAPGADAAAIPLTMDEMPVSASINRVTLNFFGDPAFVLQSDAARRPGFVLNPLDFLVAGRSGQLIATTEFAMEQQNGTVGIDIERLFVGWHGERLSIDAGRTHAELGYWNNAFHHGRWLQLPVERPRAVRFEDEGGILPIHWVGVTGQWKPFVDGDRQVEICGSIGNGRGDIVDDILTEGDRDGFKSALVRLGLKGFGLRDLRLGVSGSFDQIRALPGMAAASDPARPALPNAAILEFIANAYLAYRGPDLTLIAEAYEVLHTTSGYNPTTGTTGDRWSTIDAFALVGYRLGDYVPYVLGELRRTPTADRDPFFFPDPTVPLDQTGILTNFEEVTAGVRWDLTTWSAIKLEYRATRNDDLGTTIHRGMVDWSFGL
jgi:hypothetical protein